MYHIAICDDDEAFSKQLKQTIEDIMNESGLILNTDFDIELFAHSEMLQRKIQERQDYYQLLLLDIELSKSNGVELARIFRNQQFSGSLIYISAYRDYVFDCFDTKPLGYLLKPVNDQKFKGILLSDYRKNYADARLVLKIDGKQRVIPFVDIYALEATQHRTRIWMRDGYRDYNGALSSLKGQLPTFSFCQVHNSYIINLSHVKEIQRTEALMDDGRMFPISRRYYDLTLDKYFAFLKI